MLQGKWNKWEGKSKDQAQKQNQYSEWFLADTQESHLSGTQLWKTGKMKPANVFWSNQRPMSEDVQSVSETQLTTHSYMLGMCEMVIFAKNIKYGQSVSCFYIWCIFSPLNSDSLTQILVKIPVWKNKNNPTQGCGVTLTAYQKNM